jgi:type I restriction enzyme S subunit
MHTTTKQKPLVPELRFSGFDGEWQIKTFRDLVKINQGLQIAISERMTSPDKNSHFYITNEFLRPGNKKKYYIKNPPTSVVCNEDDVLMTRTGNTGKVVTGVSGAFHNNFFKIKYEPSELDKRFLVSFLTLPTTQNRILVMAGTSTIPDLNHTDFYKINISSPELPEQQKIADFLGSVDAWLDNLRGQKTALQSYKQGMLQKLFSGQVRFKDVGGNNFPDWEEKELGDVSVKSSSGVAAGSLEGNTGDYAVYGASGLYKHVDFYQEEEPYIAIIKDGSGVGRAAIYPGKSSVISTLNVLRATSGNDLYFVYLLLLRLNLLKYVIGGAIPHIYYKDYRREKIMVPVREEQQKIADFLTALDQTITAKADEITKVEEWKKGLMQKMFV